MQVFCCCRTGIPLSLALVYAAVAERLGVPVELVCVHDFDMPGIGSGDNIPQLMLSLPSLPGVYQLLKCGVLAIGVLCLKSAGHAFLQLLHNRKVRAVYTPSMRVCMSATSMQVNSRLWTLSWTQ